MTKVKIVTDSTVDLPADEMKTLSVTVVPLTVTIDGKSYQDGVDITAKEFLQKLKQSDDIPKSSQPAAGEFKRIYDELGADGSEVISIHMSSGMSGTYQSAVQAAEMTNTTVHTVDSAFISIALSFQVKEAAELAEKENGVEEILDRLEQVRKRTSLYIMVDTLEYLVKGGRIGRGRALVGSLLKIKPIASLQDGVYTPVSKVRTYSQMIKQMKQQLEQDCQHASIKGIGIAQAGAEKLAGDLKQSLSGLDVPKSFPIVDTTPIISTHTGPGALALMYYTEERSGHEEDSR
ncbi:DegV family protein [Alkalicoccus luteus]|uniref:DegV family protein n=1 Tax=Alkalicoccus luteus TaxID=1237094 RepID=UPI00403325B8